METQDGRPAGSKWRAHHRRHSSTRKMDEISEASIFGGEVRVFQSSRQYGGYAVSQFQKKNVPAQKTNMRRFSETNTRVRAKEIVRHRKTTPLRKSLFTPCPLSRKSSVVGSCP